MSKLKHLLLMIIMIIFISNFVFAENISCKTITFVDNNISLVNYIVYIEDFHEKEQIGSLMDFNGKIKLCDDFDKQYVFNIKSLVDNKIYFSMVNIALSSEEIQTFNVLPIANIYGIVMDAYDNLLPNAKLEFQCPNSLTEIFPTQTNNFGIFNVKNIPFGECVVLAEYDDNFGFFKINIDENIDNHISIVITDDTEKNNLFYWLLFFLVIIIVFLIIKYLYLPKYKLNIKEKDVFESVQITDKMNFLMKTFNDNEIKIVNFLISEGGCASQTKIRQNTLIPKTSLHRYVLSLEQKNIIKTFSIGKIKKIELSDFFLNNQ